MNALANAIELVKAAGYTVRKPSKRISKASKAQKGPSGKNREGAAYLFNFV